MSATVQRHPLSCAWSEQGFQVTIRHRNGCPAPASRHNGVLRRGGAVPRTTDGLPGRLRTQQIQAPRLLDRTGSFALREARCRRTIRLRRFLTVPDVGDWILLVAQCLGTLTGAARINMPEPQDSLTEDTDDYPLIVRIQRNLRDEEAWNDLVTRRNPELIGWFAGAPGVRHPQTKKLIEGPKEGAQKADVRNSAEDLAQDTWAYLANGVIPGTTPRAVPTPKILLFDPARASFHSFLLYWGSVILLRWYSKHWPPWAVFVAIMDLLPRFPGLENEADVLENLPLSPSSESDTEDVACFRNILKPVHDLVSAHFRIAFSSGHAAHKVLAWVLVDALRRPPLKIPDVDRRAEFEKFSVSLRPEFFGHFSNGSKADEQQIGSWWQPLQSILNGAGEQTLLGNAETPNKLTANLTNWAWVVRNPIENQLGKCRHLFDVIKDIAEREKERNKHA